MAAPNPSGFDPDAVEAGLRTAMRFGSAGVTFILPQALPSGAVTTDGHGVPLDSDEALYDVEQELTGVLCAYEALSATDDTSDRGGVNAQTPSVVVTLLRDEYDQVSDCTAVMIGGTRYNRVRNPLPYNLGTVEVLQIVFQAGDAL